MTAYTLVSGVLFRDPEQRMSKAGKPFVTATMRVKDGDATSWWKLLCFSEPTRAELLRLNDGEAISAQGRLTAETYTKDGQTRLALGVIADHVLALRQPPKARQPRAKPPEKKERTEQRRGLFDPHDDAGYVHPALNDEIPF